MRLDNDPHYYLLAVDNPAVLMSRPIMNTIKIILVGFVTTRALRCILLKLNFNW